jgi:hypothetical protein
MTDQEAVWWQNILMEYPSPEARESYLRDQLWQADRLVEILDAENARMRRGYLDDVSGGYIRLRPSRRVDALKLDSIAPIGSNLDVAHG